MEDRLKMRASDTDRQQVVDRLGDALACGRLTMDEYVDRMGHAYQAVTHGDLAPLCADLPAGGPLALQGGARSMKAPAAGVARRGMLAGLPTVLRVLWVKWLVAVSVNVVVWALVSSTSGHLAYPWPVCRAFGWRHPVRARPTVRRAVTSSDCCAVTSGDFRPFSTRGARPVLYPWCEARFYSRADVRAASRGEDCEHDGT